MGGLEDWKRAGSTGGEGKLLPARRKASQVAYRVELEVLLDGGEELVLPDLRQEEAQLPPVGLLAGVESGVGVVWPCRGHKLWAGV